MAPRALSSNPSAGSLSAPSPGSTAAAGSPRTGKTATTMRSPSSTWHQSASCSEGSAIPHNVSGRTLRTLPANSNWIDIAYNNTNKVLVAISNSSTNYVALSGDGGQTWQLQPMASPISGQLPAQTWKAIAWHPAAGVFVAVSSASTTAYAVSKDGVAWSAETLPGAPNAW